MLTQENIVKYQTMIANGQVPTTPEEKADYEVVKAMMTSSAMAATVAQPAASTPAPVQQPIVPITPAVAPLQPVAAEPAYMPIMPENGSAFTMEDAMKSSLAVDAYLKVKFGQTFIGDDVVSNDPIYVKIDLNSVVVKLAIKAGNPVKYFSTINGRDCLQGGSWADVVADMRKIDPKAQPYYCVDLGMQVAKDVKGFDGHVVSQAGAFIGHTTATTNWKDWSRFYAALPTHTGSVFVRLTRQDIKKNNNQWGLLNFEYVTDEQAQALALVG